MTAGVRASCGHAYRHRSSTSGFPALSLMVPLHFADERTPNQAPDLNAENEIPLQQQNW